MSNEKYNNPIGWRAELDQLSSLPGEDGSDRNASWDKLDRRLRSRRSTKKSLWYWLAAACILACMFIVSISKYNKKENAVQPIVRHIAEPVKQESTTPVAVKTEENIHHVAIKPAGKKHIAVSPSPVIKEEPQLIADKAPLVQEENVNESAPVVKNDIKQKPVVFPMLKKKLPVVHINELEKPVQQPETVAQNVNRSSFRERIFSRERLQEPASSYNPGGNILTIKLSPQN